MLQSPTANAENRAFQRAVAQYTVSPNESAKPIETMMRLAHEGQNLIIRRWAANWLASHCNILIVTEQQGADNAAQAASANIH